MVLILLRGSRAAGIVSSQHMKASTVRSLTRYELPPVRVLGVRAGCMETCLPSGNEGFRK